MIWTCHASALVVLLALFCGFLLPVFFVSLSLVGLTEADIDQLFKGLRFGSAATGVVNNN